MLTEQECAANLLKKYGKKRAIEEAWQYRCDNGDFFKFNAFGVRYWATVYAMVCHLVRGGGEHENDYETEV